MTTLRQIENKQNAEQYTNEKVQLTEAQFETFCNKGVFILDHNGKVFSHVRSDELVGNIRKLEALDAIDEACSQLSLIHGLITQATNGIELNQEALAGFGVVLDNIQAKLQRCRYKPKA